MKCDCLKKPSVVVVCYVSSILLCFGFVVRTIADYIQYNSTLHSAPFYLWIVANVVYFIVPAIIVLVVAFVIKKKIKDYKN